MTVIVPLAGYGTRLRPLTFSVPKPLLLCAGDPILGWIFKSISGLSPSAIILIVGYQEDTIRDWVGEHYGDLPVKWVIQEEAKGLGHAVWKAGKVVSPESDVLIYLGDTIFDLDWNIVKEGKDNFIGVKRVEEPQQFGVVEVENNRIIDLVEKPEKPTSDLAVVGLYYIKKWDFLYRQLNFLIEEDIKTQNEYQLTDALKLMLEKEDTELKILSVRGWYDCGKIDTLLQTNAGLLKNPPDWIDFKSKINNYSYISSSSRLENTELGHFVTVGENSLIEKSSIRNSIIGNSVKIVNSDIFDSIIGDESEIINVKGKFILGSNSFIRGKERR
ncbi:NTP transferase domain-containing protein [candidate division WOR-3 bacterium]|nr:NTP transferase domain-containing protein [candidate division WOR-3 bacterium]